MPETRGTGLPELDDTVRLMLDEGQAIRLATDEDAEGVAMYIATKDGVILLRLGAVTLELEPDSGSILGALLVALAKELEVRGG